MIRLDLSKFDCPGFRSANLGLLGLPCSLALVLSTQAIYKTHSLLSHDSPSSSLFFTMVRRSPFYHAPFQNLPLDILYPILSQLTDRKDWYSCSLVSKTFCRIATPFLYRTLDSRIISKVCFRSPFTSDP